MKEIPLTQGLTALIDDEDYERVMQYKRGLIGTNNGRNGGQQSRLTQFNATSDTLLLPKKPLMPMMLPPQKTSENLHL